MRLGLATLLLVVAAAPPARACHHEICVLLDGSNAQTTGWVDANASTAVLGVTLTAGELLFDVPLLLGDGLRGAIGWRKPHWLSMTETVVGGIELAATGALLVATWAGPDGDGGDTTGRGALTALLIVDGAIAGLKLGLGIRGLRRERPQAFGWDLVPTGSGVYAVGRF